MSRIWGSVVIDFHTCKLSFNLTNLCCSCLEEVEVKAGCCPIVESSDTSSFEIPAVQTDHSSLVLGTSGWTDTVQICSGPCLGRSGLKRATYAKILFSCFDCYQQASLIADCLSQHSSWHLLSQNQIADYFQEQFQMKNAYNCHWEMMEYCFYALHSPGSSRTW